MHLHPDGKEGKTMDQNGILKYVEPVLNFCRKRLNNPYDAEDLAGDILLHVLTGMKKYSINSPDAWIWRCCRFIRNYDHQIEWYSY